MPSFVVFGAGGLSFGLLVPLLGGASFDVVVASRVATSEESSRLNRIVERRALTVCSCAEAQLPPFTFTEFMDSSTDQGRADVVTLLSSADCKGIVTAAREGFAEAAALLESASDSRPPDAERLIVVCADNDPSELWASTSLRKRSNLCFCESIADRICIRFPFDYRDVDVMIEEYGRWVIDLPTGCTVATMLQSPNVLIVDDIERHRRRKLLCVNGFQLALSLFADRAWYRSLNAWINDNPAIASEIADQVANAYLQLDPTEPEFDIRSYVRDNLHRFGSTPDRPRRMFGLKEGALYGLPEDLDRRIAERLQPLLASGQPRLTQAGQLAHELRGRWAERQLKEGST